MANPLPTSQILPSESAVRQRVVARLREAPSQDGGMRDDRNSPKRRERSEEHTSELQSLMRSSYAVFCLKKKNNKSVNTTPDKLNISIALRIERTNRRKA